MAKREASIDMILKLFCILEVMSKGTTSYRIQDENALYFLTFSTGMPTFIVTVKTAHKILIKIQNYFKGIGVVFLFRKFKRAFKECAFESLRHRFSYFGG